MKKFKKIFLHVGSDKTGSTTIQSALNLSRKNLISSGLLAYPPSNLLLKLGGFFHKKPSEFIHFREQGILDEITASKISKEVFERFDNWLNNIDQCEILVLSYEGYITLPEESLRKFYNYLLNFSDIVKAIFYIRPPLSYTLSAMSQNVKFGRCSNQPIPIYPYKISIQKLINVFGPDALIIRKFDKKSLKNGDVLTDFIDQVGVPSNSIERNNEKKDNVSLSDDGLLLGDSIINLIKESYLENYFNPSKFYAAVGQKLSMIPGKKFKLTKNEALYVIERVKEDVKYVQDIINIDLSENLDNFIKKEEKNDAHHDLLKSIANILFRGLIEVKDFQGKADIIDSIERIKSSMEFQADIKIKNNSYSDWLSSVKTPINISYKWFDDNQNLILVDSMRTPLGVLRKGGEKTVRISVISPDKPGKYYLFIMPVQESVAWFNDKGFDPCSIKIDVY